MFTKVGFIAATSRDKVVSAIRSAFDKHHEVDKISVLSTLVDGLIWATLVILGASNARGPTILASRRAGGRDPCPAPRVQG